jgi:hypothetical protein
MVEEDDSASPAQYPVPEWAAGAFRRFMLHLDELQALLHVAVRGMAQVQALPKLIEILYADENGTFPDTEANRLKRAKHDAAFAEREAKNDFPLLHALVAVSVWGGLEELIRSLAAQVILNEPERLAAPIFDRMKVRLGDILALDERQRAFYLVDLLDRELSGPFKVGVGRLEPLLEPFALSGDTPDDTRRTLLELHQIRNLHAHRQGFADRRFCDACPWLGTSEGEYVPVNRQKVASYCTHAAQYAFIVARRFGFRSGWTEEQFEQLTARRLAEEGPGAGKLMPFMFGLDETVQKSDGGAT